MISGSAKAWFQPTRVESMQVAGAKVCAEASPPEMESIQADTPEDLTKVHGNYDVDATTESDETTTTISSFNDPRAIQFSGGETSISFPEEEVEDITQAFEITFERRRPEPGE